MAVLRRLILVTLAVALTLAPANASAAQGTQCEGADTALTFATITGSERSLLCLVNVYRAANGRGPLTLDPSLRTASRAHSNHMEATSQFAHEGIGDGTPASRAAAAGYPFGVGENIAYSTFPAYTPTGILEQFRASPPHNANMLDPPGIVYVTAGMGIAVGANLGVTTTQMFGLQSNGATDTAADLLTSPACDAATAAIAPAEQVVAKAKKRLQRADAGKQRDRARRALKKAKRALQSALETERTQCALTY